MGEFDDHGYDFWDDQREYHDREHDSSSLMSRCNRCGETGLLWQQVGVRWQLFKLRGHTLSAHECSPKKLQKRATSAFDELDS